MTLELNDLPDIDFVDTDINKILNDMITGYEKAYYDSTGKQKKLYPGDPLRIWLYSQALREFQLRVMIDDAAKQNLLKYARKDNLQQLGAFSHTELFPAQAAKTKMKIALSQAQPSDEYIPSGTRVSPGNDVYFETEQDEKIPGGVQEIEFNVVCTEEGEVGNGYTPGQINVLVDPLPWAATVENIETSQGGADEEDADSYRERIHLAPEGFSVAGPKGAYEYFAKQYSSLIGDLKITSPSDGVVDIRVLLKDGELPEELFIEELEDYLSAKERRPLTDKVEISIPDTVEYDIDINYFISKNRSAQEQKIREKIERAIEEYEVWQRSRIGRDVNPDELIFKIKQAGAKRVEIVSPEFKEISDTELAIIDVKNVEYGGLEDE